MVFYEFFFKKEELTDDDERLYNPLTGKYYEIDFEGEEVIYEKSINQESTISDDLNKQQKKFQELRIFIENTEFKPIEGEGETDQVFEWLQNFDLVNSIIQKSKDKLYFSLNDIILVLYTSTEFYKVGFYTIFRSNRFTKQGIMTSKDDLALKIEEIFPSLMKSHISSEIDQYYDTRFEDPVYFKSRISRKALLLMIENKDLSIEFKDGHIIIFQDLETSKNQIKLILELVKELK